MQYPYDIYSAVRRKSTFSIEGHFFKKEDESPMKIFDDTFSRYVMTIIQEGTAAYFNLHVDDLPGIRAKTDIATKLQYTPSNNVSGGHTSPAFTKRFAGGNLKGKTPIDVLLEDPDKGKDVLNSQYKWLKENLEKYPKNQEMMDAIMDATKQDLSSLSKEDTPAAAPITLLEIGCRPLQRKKRDDGKCLCYEGKVVWDPSRDYNVSIEAKNYYAPVNKREDGTLNVDLSNKDRSTEKVHRFNMSGEEWLAALYTMEQTRDEFRIISFNKAYQLAEAEGKRNRENSQIA